MTGSPLPSTCGEPGSARARSSRSFRAVFLDLYAGRTRPSYDVPAFEPYPKTNEQKIIGEIEGYRTWPVHKPDLDMSRIVEFTKLQLWTLKPARAAR